MKERELSGNHMFKVVKNECERIIGKDENKLENTGKIECENILSKNDCKKI